MASQAKLTLRPPPNVEFVQGFPGIPPLLPDRPPACVKGAVEVRLGGGPVKAKWIKVELRKIETLPGGGQANTYVELIGESPLIVWQSREEWDELMTHDFPFQIRIPEAIPPSIALERNAGIKYELVASVLVKGKRGLLRRDATPILSSSCQIVVDKHELHSAWPIYAQPESRSRSVDGHTLTVNRTHTAFGPGDRIAVQTIVKNDARQTNHIRYYEFALLEHVVYRPGPQGNGRRNGPQLRRTPVQEQRIPITITSPLHPGMQAKAELSLQVPMSHTTTTVSYAQRIEVNYIILVKAVLAGGQQLALDLPVTMSNWTRSQSTDAVRRIGFAPNLSGPEQHRPPSADIRYPQSMPPPQPQLPPSFTWGPPLPPSATGPVPGAPSGYLPNGAQSPFAPGMNPSAPQQTGASDFGGGWSFQSNGPAMATIGGMPLRPDPLDEFGRAPSSTYRASTYVTSWLPTGGFGQPNSTALSPSQVNGAPNGTRSVASRSDGGSASNDGVTPRRPRAGSAAPANRFTVVNVDSDHESEAPIRSVSATAMSAISKRYPSAEEEKRKIQEAMNKAAEQNESPAQGSSSFNQLGDAPISYETSGGSSSNQPDRQPKQWLTAEEEKARLGQQNQAYEAARQRAARMQAIAESGFPPSSMPDEPTPTDPVTPMRRPTAESVNTYPSAAEEKFMMAAAAVERAQGINLAPTAGIGFMSPGRASGMNVWATESSSAGGSRMSPGQALYQNAKANMRTSNMDRSDAAPSTSNHANSQLYKSAAEEKAEIRFRQAREAAAATQMGSYANSDPVPYEALFPTGGPSGSSQQPPVMPPTLPLNVHRGPSPTMSNGYADESISEKERVRRAFAARDAAAAMAPSDSPRSSLSRDDRSGANGTIQSSPLMSPPVVPNGPMSAFEEKERLKAKFAAEDGGSSSTSFFTPVQAPREAPANGNGGWTPAPPLPRPPPALPAPPPRAGGINGHSETEAARQLTAAEEKALLQAKYANVETPPPAAPETPEPPPRPQVSTLTVEDADRPMSSGGLRRDPTISLGKRRAPIESSPPPLPQKPPAEYYMNAHGPHGNEDEDDSDLYDNRRISIFNPIDMRPFSPFSAEEFSAPSIIQSSSSMQHPPPLPPKVPL
ncbi:hypothetical protein FRB97_002993 [Tulasnella sp. 331]|nr:hypothetical protein FRB97_002993 [Tulasnella sp. 331]KAG8891112.1 hypothetical protein FRB98_000121 [Tulasnella sp. 332]